MPQHWIRAAAKLVSALATGLFLVSCAHNASEPELKSLLTGTWNTSSHFATNTGTTRIVTQAQGHATFQADGAMVQESASVMTISLPEGELVVNYHAVVQGQWSLSGYSLRITRTGEEITPKDEASRKFIEHTDMKKLRAQGPAQFDFTLQRVSAGSVVAVDAQGARTIYTRGR